MRRDLLRERDLRSTQVSPSVVLSLLNKVTTRLFLLGSSARVKAFASLACRKGDERFGSEVDFSAFLTYVGFASQAAVQLVSAQSPKPTIRRLRQMIAKGQGRITL